MPIAYSAANKMLNASELASLIPKSINAIQTARLKVSVTRKAAKLLNTSLATPYFYDNSDKIYFIYDFPHIIKCIQNYLMKRKSGCFVGQMRFTKALTSEAQKVCCYTV